MFPLPQNAHRTWIEVSSAALRHNVEALRSCAPAGAALMAVVKANAYGHGLAHVVQALRGLVDWLGVANLEEARQARGLACALPVLILGPALPSERSQIVSEGFVPMVSCLEEVESFASYAGATPVPVHLAVDVGMGRIGVDERAALNLAREIQRISGVTLSGVGAHFPSADEDDIATQEQSHRFAALVRAMRAEGLVCGPAHIANSAGVIAFPDSASEIFRTGLALYGWSPRPEFQSALKPALTWKTRVTLVREVGEGRGISYGSTYVTPRPMRIATLAVGYADGYRRHLSGKGASVLLGGRRCAVLGRVTMDQIMVDVSALSGVAAGSEAVLLGEQGGACLDVGEMAAVAGTIPWDIFTGLGHRVVRVVMD